MTRIHLFVPVFLLFVFTVSTVAEIVQVVVVSRHCDRTPISAALVPKNPVNWKKKFGLAPGQLTGLGIWQCQAMGASLRQRYLMPSSSDYITNITQHFDSDMFKLYSTSVDRTIISLNSAAQGLFPNGTGLINDITGKPSLPNDITMVPVHTVQLSQDILLRGYDKCPKIKANQEAFKKSKEYQQISNEYAPLIDQIYNWTGIRTKDLSDFYFTYDMLNTLKCHNLLTLQPVLDNWNKIDALGMYSQYIFFDRAIQGNLGAGPLADAIYNTMEKAIQQAANVSPKYVHYSAHDTTLQSLLATLDIAETYAELRNIPPYGCQIIFELHRDRQGNHSVKIVIRLGYDGEPFKAYKLPKYCTSDLCEWSQFSQYINEVSRVSLQNWCHKCGNTVTGPCVSTLLTTTRNQNMIMLVASPVIAVALLMTLSGLLISLVLRFRKKETSNYEHLVN